ncbi:hypothetical protein BCF33_0339 [Hasllibacter halocynthiae]|uniref:Uncharacterized protein n=1 Tax=Hasllibacter halocynthiae TaxID=595589 RepID=A0A2T0X705_9RHOB|nr:DUF6476 family protein [Hasllibacter halocynthiae]PRY94741.1 hypothetical protein BCF33_0339 [Hasllibacter halocynthiae]
MSDPDPQQPAIPELRFLKVLVTTLTVTMILGVLAIVALLVTRLPDGTVPLPDALDLPEGAEPVAFTRGPDWLAVATPDAILIYDAAGTLRRTVELR